MSPPSEQNRVTPIVLDSLSSDPWPTWLPTRWNVPSGSWKSTRRGPFFFFTVVEGKGINNPPESIIPNNQESKSKELVPQIFVPANLNFEMGREKKVSPPCFPWTLQAEIWESDLARILTSCWPVLEVPGSFYCSSFRVSSAQPIRHLTNCPKCGVEESLLYFSRFFRLAQWLNQPETNWQEKITKSKGLPWDYVCRDQ